MLPPRGGGAFYSHLNDTSRAETALSQEFSQTYAKAAHDAAILSGEGLGLDPENDPVVYTTDYGLEIKSHNTGNLDALLPDTSENITVSSTSWNYISAGGYDWIIIGSYSANSYTLSTVNGEQYLRLADGSPAGSAVKNDASKQVIKADATIPAFSNSGVPTNGEIPIGCVLCLCAEYIEKVPFGENANYVGSNQQLYIDDTIYGGISDLSVALRGLPIVPQTLKTSWNGGETIVNNAYLFPLAGYSTNESFWIETYLTTKTSRNIGAHWWLRSGKTINGTTSSYFVSYLHSPDISVTNCTGTNVGVRPAFVLQLYSYS